jgi:hypothetical protein
LRYGLFAAASERTEPVGRHSYHALSAQAILSGQSHGARRQLSYLVAHLKNYGFLPGLRYISINLHSTLTGLVRI